MKNGKITYIEGPQTQRKGGDYRKRLTRLEEVAYFEKIRSGDEEARRNFIVQNQGLIHSIARKLYSPNGPSFDDLTQMGNIGIIYAVKKFDHTRGVKFSSYATAWIMQAILRGHMQENPNMQINLPIYVQELQRRRNRFVTQYRSENGRTPTDEEISEGISASIANVRLLEDIRFQAVRLDSPAYEDEGSDKLHDVIESDEDLEGEISDTDFKYKVRSALYKAREMRIITEQELDVLKQRFGINDGLNDEELTLDAVGKQYGLTRERIRQLQISAMAKLRKNPLFVNLREEILR